MWLGLTIVSLVASVTEVEVIRLESSSTREVQTDIDLSFCVVSLST